MHYTRTVIQHTAARSILSIMWRRAAQPPAVAAPLPALPPVPRLLRRLTPRKHTHISSASYTSRWRRWTIDGGGEEEAGGYGFVGDGLEELVWQVAAVAKVFSPPPSRPF